MDLDPAICRQAVLARDARFDGRFFTAVTSTGIYCRPICPARPPKPENCRFYPSAAAAQAAGFRPCLRCRPETAPGLGAWRGASNTVSRAMALIDLGALDANGVDALATRLGVGERHLRRLFLKHLGASPVAVAQTRRVLVAKQLIHETQLSMSQIALASGFGSVRRFNETLRALFGRPPSELRRARTPAGVDQAAVTLSLGYRPPYDWPAMLAFLAARAIPGVESTEAGVYRRTITLDGVAGDIAVSHEPDRHRLRATIRFGRLAALPTIIARLRRLFDLEADPEAIGGALARDGHLARLVTARPGLRVPGAWDGFELAVRAIVGQQITVAGATRLVGNLAETFGEAYDVGDHGLTRIFPDPGVIANAAIGGMPGARASAIRSIALAAASDPAIFERGADLAASVAKLRAMPGVGEWTAQYIAMRAMREPDAFPTADVGLMRAMDLGAGRPNADALGQRARAWRPWRAYAALHLWTSEAARSQTPSGESANAIAA
jgi:AraC family transcriptional regulator, regulatory protein of adaptative response / DNA-3-methyladenine glycosylase II